MLVNIRSWGETILAKLGLISHALEGYIETALKSSTILLSWIQNPPTEVTIKALFPNLTDDLYSKIEGAVVSAIRYMTQSEAILNASTPDEMLRKFLESLATDAPGMQQTKAMRFAQEIVHYLNPNPVMRSIIDWLVQKYFTKEKVAGSVSL